MFCLSLLITLKLKLYKLNWNSTSKATDIIGDAHKPVERKLYMREMFRLTRFSAYMTWVDRHMNQ
jgi:hypothetical protein